MKKMFYTKITLLIVALFSFTGVIDATNLALSGSATASSGDAALAIDGNSGTRWESDQGPAPQTWELTLDAEYDIAKIKIHWEAANAKVYTIEASTDNTNWTEIYNETNGAEGGRWDIIDVSVTAKYLKVSCTERNLNYGYSFWEFEVYEEISDEQNATLSDLKVNGTTIAGFISETKEYTYLVSDANVPTVTATASISGSNVVIAPASAIPGTTTIEVTATDGITVNNYKVNFQVPVALPLDFESTTLNYQWGEFGAPVTVIDNPQISGINTSARVAQIVKNAGPDWNGSFITLDAPFSLSTETRVSAKFFSPRAGIKMMMKLEDEGYATAEILVATTVANEWETLTFDFEGADVTKAYTKLVIICDRETEGDGSAAHTYLVDDIALVDKATALSSSSENNIKIYTNSGILHINGLDEFMNGTVQVYNISGALVLSHIISQTSESLNLNAQGIYLVRLSDETNQSVVSQKVIIY